MAEGAGVGFWMRGPWPTRHPCPSRPSLSHSVVGQQSRRGQKVGPAPEGSTKVTSGLTTCSELGSGA